MAVAADAKELQVDPAGSADCLLVGRAVSVVIAPHAAIRDVNVARGHVHVAEEVFLHEVAEALGMRGGQAEVFVEIEGSDVREIERAGLMQADEMLVEANHGVAGGEAESERRFFLDGAGDKLRGLLVHFFVVALQDDQHAQPFRNSLALRSRTVSRKDQT